MDMKTYDLKSGVAAAIQAAGGVRALSGLLGGKPSHQSISQWKRVPAERVLQVEVVTGVPREKLRPDLYYERRRG